MLRAPPVPVPVPVPVNKNTDVDVDRTEGDGVTALHLACERGHTEMVRYLLKSAASTDVRVGSTGDTPLHLAAGKGLVEIVNVLLEYGADRRLRNAAGELPRQTALQAVLQAKTVTPGAQVTSCVCVCVCPKPIV